MSKSRDTEIKLFGKTITSLFSVNHCYPSSFSPVNGVCDPSKEPSSSSSSSCSPFSKQDLVRDDKRYQENNRSKDDYKLSDLNKQQKSKTEISSPISSKNQQSEITTTTNTTTSTSETVLKKPDKILPCPRCESINTKFCYYNNYNVNQPRYFCRNCQRYWTSGGSMRNVPVGSGRRKNKGWASSNSYLHVTSEDYDNNNNSGTVLSFGSSESSVTANFKNQSGDTKITSDSVLQEHNHYNRLLPSQVMIPNNSSPLPYQWSPSFYPIPFYWGCTVPPQCLGKRSRDQSERGTNGSTIPEKKTQGFSLFNGFETKGSNRRNLVPETTLSLQANPAAMSRSMNFRESMQQ